MEGHIFKDNYLSICTNLFKFLDKELIVAKQLKSVQTSE